MIVSSATGEHLGTWPPHPHSGGWRMQCSGAASTPASDPLCSGGGRTDFGGWWCCSCRSGTAACSPKFRSSWSTFFGGSRKSSRHALCGPSSSGSSGEDARRKGVHPHSALPSVQPSHPTFAEFFYSGTSPVVIPVLPSRHWALTVLVLNALCLVGALSHPSWRSTSQAGSLSLGLLDLTEHVCLPSAVMDESKLF